MGKGAVIAALALAVLIVTLQNSSRLTNLEAEAHTSTHQNSLVARDMALEARKVVLSHWVSTNGTGMHAPFDSVEQAGGSYRILNYTRNGNGLDYTVLAEYRGTAHEIRSRYEWNTYAAQGLQVKAANLNVEIAPLATLDVDYVVLDDQSLHDLDTMLVAELGTIDSLGQIGLGWSDLQNDLSSALSNSGHLLVDILPVTQIERDAYDHSSGVYFPDQVSQAVASYVGSYPEKNQVVTDIADVGASFGAADGYEVLTVKGDVTLSNDLSGVGVLVIEGNFRVLPEITFDWTGIVLVRPPSTNLNPYVDLGGLVTISGSLVAMQEGVPNFGHMDVSVLRDYSGVWSLPSGQDGLYYSHVHDYSGIHGWQVLFRTDGVPAVPLSATKFNAFLSAYNPAAEIYLELFNANFHGRALLTMELADGERYAYPVAAGFDPNLRSAGSAYVSQPFRIKDLVYLDIVVTRLSALNRLWDSEDAYPNCAYNSITKTRTWATNCTWGTPDRMGDLTLRVRLGDGKLVYEAPLYWHRRRDEIEDFKEEMADLLDTITSADYGLDLTIGPDVSLSTNAAAIATMGAFGGNALGLIHLGTWQRAWAAGESGNPVNHD
ncbi:MAG: hypothetical protein SH809_17335 [Rhodothermales bacterium]|nr:hypothetical protein [Rhodothermales bacterium]